MDAQWGYCKHCKWWQIEPDAEINNNTPGFCIDEDLQAFELRITGGGGCNNFMAGKPARAKGSAFAPPIAVPQR